MGDNALVLGHRMSEWCGHAPQLEEDIALANTALDLIGQCQMWLAYAGEAEGQGRSADDLAYLRDAWDFRNVLMVELPNGDYGRTIMRACLFDLWHVGMLTALQDSSDPRVAEIAAKAVKEATYHLERSSETVIGLGDGTEESHARMQTALDDLWPYVGEFFASDEVDVAMAADGVAPDPAALRDGFDARLAEILDTATLTAPESDFSHTGGRDGFRHTEHLGHMLAVMQVLPRSHPGAEW